MEVLKGLQEEEREGIERGSARTRLREGGKYDAKQVLTWKNRRRGSGGDWRRCQQPAGIVVSKKLQAIYSKSSLSQNLPSLFWFLYCEIYLSSVIIFKGSFGNF